jgi:hypothetical protein
MSRPSPKPHGHPLQALLRSHPGLRCLFTRVVELRQLQDQLEQLLPPHMLPHYRVTTADNGVLTLYADSPAWAARLRLLAPQVLQYLHAPRNAGRFNNVRVKVTVQDTLPETPSRRLKLNPQTAQLLRKAAETLRDSRLKSSLLRLSLHSSE